MGGYEDRCSTSRSEGRYIKKEGGGGKGGGRRGKKGMRGRKEGGREGGTYLREHMKC